MINGDTPTWTNCTKSTGSYDRHVYAIDPSERLKDMRKPPYTLYLQRGTVALTFISIFLFIFDPPFS